MTIGRDNSGKFLPGTGGRQAGTRNKLLLQSAFIKALHHDFAEHGPAVIKIVRIEQPDVYLKVIARQSGGSRPSSSGAVIEADTLAASVLPKELVLAEEQPLESMSDEELLQALATIKQLRAAEKQQPSPEAKLH